MTSHDAFARGVIAGCVSMLDPSDKLWVATKAWETTTTYAGAIAGLRTMEALARARGFETLAVNIASIRTAKERWRADHPACPVCDQTVTWSANDPFSETGYCFQCQRLWSRSGLLTEAKA